MKTLTALIACSLLGAAAPVAAQGFPTRPLSIVVPFGAGSVTDITSAGAAGSLRSTTFRLPMPSAT